MPTRPAGSLQAGTSATSHGGSTYFLVTLSVKLISTRYHIETPRLCNGSLQIALHKSPIGTVRERVRRLGSICESNSRQQLIMNDLFTVAVYDTVMMIVVDPMGRPHLSDLRALDVSMASEQYIGLDGFILYS